jgi:hypothetical protein
MECGLMKDDFYENIYDENDFDLIVLREYDKHRKNI